jgi:hypothetical protein
MDLRASCNRRIAGHCVDGNLEPTLDTREGNRVMGLQQDVSPYGSQTVMGPGWPNVDEDALAASAAQYEALAAKLTGSAAESAGVAVGEVDRRGRSRGGR